MLTDTKKITLHTKFPLILHLLPWLMWMLSTSFVFYQSILQVSISIMIPDLERSFSISSGQVGFLSSSFFYSYLLLQLPAGMLVDRFGARLVLSLSILPCVICVWLFTMVHHFVLAEMCRIGMGVFAAPAVAGTLAIASYWFSAQQFALVVGLTEMSGMVGAAAGEYFLAGSVAHYGWRFSLTLIVIFGGVLNLVVSLLLRNHPQQLMHHHSVRTLKGKDVWRNFAKIISNVQIWLNGWYCGLIFALVPGFAGLWCVPYLQARFPISLQIAAIGSSIILIGVAVGCPLVGWFSDYLPKRKTVMYGGTALYLILLLTVLYWPHAFIALIFLLLFFVGLTAGVYVLAFAIVRDITPQTVRGTAMAFINMLSMIIGGLVLQPLIGFLLKIDSLQMAETNLYTEFSLHAFDTVLVVLPLCAVVGLIIIPFIKEPQDVNQNA